MNKAMTDANIGRSMKKRERFTRLFAYLPTGVAIEAGAAVGVGGVGSGPPLERMLPGFGSTF